MEKYIDADLLRKEIEFAKSVYSNPERVVHGVADAYRQDGRAAMCDDILKKIDSLQQEQQEMILEEMDGPAIEAELVKLYGEMAHPSEFDVARRFYKLGKYSK